MPVKHPRHDTEIEQLAKDLAGRWMQGDGVEPWLRIMEPELSRKVRSERWSWESIACALNSAGIRYQTARPWTGDGLRKKMASIRYEGRKRALRKCADTSRTNTWNPPAAAVDTSPTILIDDEEPEFKPISLLNWSGKLITDEEKPPKKEPVPAPKIDVAAVLAKFTGRK